MRTRPELGHSPEIILLSGCESIESYPEEILVECLGSGATCRIDVRRGDRGLGGRVPCMLAPFLQEVWIAPRYGDNLLERFRIDLRAFIADWPADRTGSSGGSERADTRVVEQAL